VAASLGALVVVTYVVALGTGPGRSFDVRAGRVPGLEEIRPGSPELLVFSLPWMAAAGSVVLLAFAVAAAALRVGGERGVVAAAVPVAGAFVIAEVLKWLLGRLTPIAAGTQHGAAASFPSVHATLGMALALALATVAPGRLRPAALGLAVAYSTGIGVLALLEGWHYPSDVIGGCLLGAAWALLGRPPSAPDARGRSSFGAAADRYGHRLRLAAIGALSAALALLAVALLVSALRFVPDWILVGPLFAGAATIAAAAAATVLAVARATAP
jgi:hypothetical protein